jgi:hypothetical protein
MKIIENGRKQQPAWQNNGGIMAKRESWRMSAAAAWHGNNNGIAGGVSNSYQWQRQMKAKINGGEMKWHQRNMKYQQSAASGWLIRRNKENRKISKAAKRQ